MGVRDDPAHGSNKVRSSAKKKGGNKGIAAARRAERRAEAEKRNAQTPFERTKQYRRENGLL